MPQEKAKQSRITTAMAEDLWEWSASLEMVARSARAAGCTVKRVPFNAQRGNPEMSRRMIMIDDMPYRLYFSDKRESDGREFRVPYRLRCRALAGIEGIVLLEEGAGLARDAILGVRIADLPKGVIRSKGSGYISLVVDLARSALYCEGIYMFSLGEYRTPWLQA